MPSLPDLSQISWGRACKVVDELLDELRFDALLLCDRHRRACDGGRRTEEHRRLLWHQRDLRDRHQQRERHDIFIGDRTRPI